MKIVTFKVVKNGPGNLIEYLTGEFKGVRQGWHFVNLELDEDVNPQALAEMVGVVSEGSLVIQAITTREKATLPDPNKKEENLVPLVPAPKTETEGEDVSGYFDTSDPRM